MHRWRPGFARHPGAGVGPGSARYHADRLAQRRVRQPRSSDRASRSASSSPTLARRSCSAAGSRSSPNSLRPHIRPRSWPGPSRCRRSCCSAWAGSWLAVIAVAAEARASRSSRRRPRGRVGGLLRPDRCPAQHAPGSGAAVVIAGVAVLVAAGLRRVLPAVATAGRPDPLAHRAVGCLLFVGPVDRLSRLRCRRRLRPEPGPDTCRAGLAGPGRDRMVAAPGIGPGLARAVRGAPRER